MRTDFVILLLAWLSTYSVESQFGREYRSWLGLALRSNPYCFPDGNTCIRRNDCCSTYCADVHHGRNICKPSYCGCPQPPFSPEPIIEKCHDYDMSCEEHHQCCSGYCVKTSEGKLCHYPPCVPCD